MVAANTTAAAELGAMSKEAHPRPDWIRPWVSCDGAWRFAFDPDDKGLDEKWFAGHSFESTITVPFPWQSELSGIHRPDYDGVAWYEREILLPKELPFPRAFLVIGACDWRTTVWVNGQEMLTHEGGYDPFEVELTELVKPGETARVTLRVFDPNDPTHLTGKQVRWYTHVGGIWQPVYLDFRGEEYIAHAHVTPDIDAMEASVKVAFEGDPSGEVLVTVLDEGTRAKPLASGTARVASRDTTVTVALADAELWTPEHPVLYDARVELRRDGKVVDAVDTYFGMREVAADFYDGSDHKFVLLNHKPVYLRGALNQAFTPEGIYAYPSLEYMRNDLEKTKEFGLNFLRIHIKPDDPRFLYLADKLGVLLQCDMPNWWDKGEGSRAEWEHCLREIVARDFNHPSIVSWVDFNETWGIGHNGYDRDTQEWVRDMYLLTKELDPTRLVEDNSPCNWDHVATDLNSWHFYNDDYAWVKRHIEEVVRETYPGSEFNYAEGWTQDDDPLMNSEYGGVSAGSGDRDISWVFLWITELLRKEPKIVGYIYTELMDIEWEHNGFMNYDRRPKEYHYPAGITLDELQDEEFLVFDMPPYVEAKAGETLELPMMLSHWSERDGLSVRISAYGQTVDGKEWNSWIAPSEQAVDVPSFTVTAIDPVSITVPNANGLLSIIGEVLDHGKRVAANYRTIRVQGSAAWNGANDVTFAIPAMSYSENTFAEGSNVLTSHFDKAYGYGTGVIEYVVKFPADLDPDAIEGARLIAEVGAQANRERVDWSEHKHPQDYPQTDEPAYPSDIVVAFETVDVGRVTVANDFADARGVLSHVAGFHHGSHGVVVDMPLDFPVLQFLRGNISGDEQVTMRFEVPVDAEHKGGLSIYGANMGMWPSDPVLVFTLKEGAKKPTGMFEVLNARRDRVTVLLQRGPKHGHTWKYTYDEPKGDWKAADYDDRGWKSGQGGFGPEGSTPWKTKDIWLRTEIEVPKTFGQHPVYLDLSHDDDVQVYVNGEELLRKDRWTNTYETHTLSERQVGLFKAGAKNTIAVHCWQSHGGQFIDLGLVTID